MLSLRSEHKRRDNAANVLGCQDHEVTDAIWAFSNTTAVGDEDETSLVFFSLRCN